MKCSPVSSLFTLVTLYTRRILMLDIVVSDTGKSTLKSHSFRTHSRKCRLCPSLEWDSLDSNVFASCC